MDNNANKKLTREEALEALGLSKDANLFAIDDKFYKLTKQYRNDNSEESKQKLEELSELYNIATGNRDKETEKLTKREAEHKILGKTKNEWSNFFYYAKWKIVIGIIIIIAASNLFYTIFLKPRKDCSIVSLGHFTLEQDILTDFLKNDMDFKNPSIIFTDIVVPNDYGEVGGTYSEQISNAQLLSNPNVLVFDEITCLYYFEQLEDLSTLYGQLQSTLDSETLAQITPVYYSARDYITTLNSNSYNTDVATPNPDDYDNEKKLIGFKITDEDVISNMGYQSLWAPEDEKPSLVIGIYNQTQNHNDSERIIEEILKCFL